MTAVDSPDSRAVSVSLRSPSWQLGSILDDVAENFPGSTALIVGDQRSPISYATLAALVVDHCAALQRCGLRRGDAVALRATNSIEFVVALLAAARAGLVVAPLDPALSAAERRARTDRVGARLTLTDVQSPDPGASGSDCPEWRLEALQPGTARAKPLRDFAAGPRHIAAPVRGLTDRDALIMFTSGTTGTPKMVPWTHDNLGASIAGIAGAYQLSPSDATVAAMPLFHGHGLIATLLSTLATGGAIVLPARGRFSARTFWDDVTAVHASWYTAVPTIHQILLNRADDDRSARRHARLRFIRSCSAPLAPATAQRIETTFNAPVLAAYGMTETTHQASSALASDGAFTRTYTVGTPTSVSARVLQADGQTCPPGASGEIWLHGPTVVRGYLDNAAATATTFADGWVRTGDLGSLRRDGTLTLQGRIKELINRGGEKISPEHVEQVLTSYPGVADAVVFGIPDDLYGERVAAVVLPDNGSKVDSGDLTSYCRDRLSPFEIPERITFTDELPRTAKGSVDRSQIAQRFR